jgi:hypothetical protein
MILKNTAGQGVYLYSYDTTNKVPKTGDAANTTGNISLDGGAPVSFNATHPTEIGGGIYWQPFAQGETNGNAGACYWSSSTTGIQVDPVLFLSTGISLPTAAPGASGGLPTTDAANGCKLSVGTGTGQVSLTTGTVPINLAQTGLSPRALDSVSDGSLTVGDALVGAIVAAAGKESVSGTSYVVQTPSTGTTIRTFTLNSSTAPTTRS